jgi:hypothetical protein
MKSLIVLKEASPFHHPEVRGWDGLTALAHLNTFWQKGKEEATLPELPT